VLHAKWNENILRPILSRVIYTHIHMKLKLNSITNDPNSISPTLHSLPCHIILKVFGSTEKVIVERC